MQYRFSICHKTLLGACKIARYELGLEDWAREVVDFVSFVLLHVYMIMRWHLLVFSNMEKFEAINNIYGSISIGQSMIFCSVSW